MSDCYYLVQNDDGKWEKADFYDMDNPIEALTKAYQQGKADAIEPIKSIIQESEKMMWCADKTLEKIREHLKEHGNE